MMDLYQELILHHNKSPCNHRKILCPTCYACGHNYLCGDKVEVFVVIKENIIADISFQAIGCALCVSSGSLMTEILKNKTIEEAKDMFKKFHALVTGKSDDIVGLGKLEVFSHVNSYPARVKCTLLGWHAFKNAIKDI